MKIDPTIICLFCVVFLAAILYLDVFFRKKDNNEKIKAVKQWLLFCVTKMENIYGSGTGQLKLQAAWDLAIQRFPFITILVSFDEFSQWVDEALVQMKELLKNNKINNIVVNQLFE